MKRLDHIEGEDSKTCVFFYGGLRACGAQTVRVHFWSGLVWLGPADSVEKNDRNRTVGSEVSIFGHFHHTRHVSMSQLGPADIVGKK